MAKRRSLLSEKSILARIKKGYGKGEGKDYKPWLEIHDVPSLGKSSRQFGIKTGRIHHFLSTLELNLFFTLEWSDSVLDIREQYPLLGREETISIAERKGIKHPTDPKTSMPIVMTTDFLVTSLSSNKNSFMAISVKPSEKLNNKRVIDKLEIERTYWGEKGIDWKLVNRKELPKTLAANINWVYRHRRIEDLGWENPDYPLRLSSILLKKLVISKDSIQLILDSLDRQNGAETGTFLKLFKYLVGTKQVGIDMNQPIDLKQNTKSLVFLVVDRNLSKECTD